MRNLSYLRRGGRGIRTNEATEFIFALRECSHRYSTTRKVSGHSGRKSLVIADSDSPRSERSLSKSLKTRITARVSAPRGIPFQSTIPSMMHPDPRNRDARSISGHGRRRLRATDVGCNRSSREQPRKCSAGSKERRLRTRVVETGAAFAQRKKKNGPRERLERRRAVRRLDAREFRGEFTGLIRGFPSRPGSTLRRRQENRRGGARSK